MYHNQIVKGVLGSLNDKLHVISVVSNPARFQSRYRIFRDFMKRMDHTPDVIFYVVELAFGDRPFECTDNNPRHLQLRTSQELWHKENMINLGVSRLLPRDWKYLAWVDGDVRWDNPHWAMETMQQLQHHPVVQPWSDCLDLGPYGNVLQHFESFCSIHRKKLPKQRHPGEPYKYAHTGFAWACNRYFWENVGGLMDFPILGSADHHMGWALTGRVNETIHSKMSPSFFKRCEEWQTKACHVTQGDNLGYIKGVLMHDWHGPKAKRRYRERWDILIDNKYDPDQDLVKDSQGLLQIIHKPRLLSDIRDYFRQRNEDSIEEN